MGDTGKTREQLLQEWREQRSLKGGDGLANITNKAYQPTSFAGMKPTVPAPAAKQGLDLPGENSDANAGPTPSSVRRAALPPPQKQHMEDQFNLLRNRLHAIKRESVRPSISGAPNATPQQASAPAQAAAPAAAAAPSAVQRHEDTPLFGGIIAKLESLKRDSIKPSVAGPSGAGAQFEAAGQYDMQALSKMAVQLFDDKEFLQLVDKGMNSQLTRSKDGATSETKITELAGMVKLLRRGMKELQQRTQMFVDHSMRFEKEASQQIESVKLSSESSAMAMQAELANARREAATTAANHKTALATWQAELDMHRAESANLKREMDRVEGERDKAREDARKAETARIALEGELKDARKTAGQRERELAVAGNSAAQQMYEAREAAERQRQMLADALATCETRASEAEATIVVLRQQLSGAESNIARLEEQVATLQKEKESLTAEIAKVRDELAEHLQSHDKLVADGACVLSELGEWQEKAAALVVELERERDVLSTLKTEHTAALATHANERSEWANSRATSGAEAVAAAERERKLIEEKSELKASLSTALQQLTAAESAAKQDLEAATQKANEASEAAQTAQQALDEVRKETDQLKQELRTLTQEAEALRTRLESEERDRTHAQREAEDKGQRLAQLEGELEALQECTIGLGSGDQREMLSRMVSRIASLEAAVAAAEAARRDIHNQLVELKGNIRVFCRVRPHPQSIIACDKDGSSVKLHADGKEHGFGFDHVFGPDATQQAVFDQVSDLVQSALDGYKVCLFSYGQTGAGKTHTMLGSSRTPGGEGIVPRAVGKILAAAGKLRDQGWEYVLEASYVEVYNESLRDLLADKESKARITENNAIQHAPNGGHTVVLGATRVSVETEEDAAALVRKASAARAQESTAMNATSSRSHSIFMLYITGKQEATGTILQGSLNLVDLAGSERLNRSQVEGARAREACNINKSLSSLGDVFQALSTKAAHIPYRNSKLTHLLQPCLGGSGKTLMFVNINPESESAGESLCSLRFAAKVNACETAAKGGASRNVSTLDPFSGAGRPSLSGRPSLTGRPSIMGRPSIAPGDADSRRMSMIPGAGAGVKRKAGMPPVPSAAGRMPKPRLN